MLVLLFIAKTLLLKVYSLIVNTISRVFEGLNEVYEMPLATCLIFLILLLNIRVLNTYNIDLVKYWNSVSTQMKLVAI